MEEIIKAIFQYGGTIIMAGLFVWLFFWIMSELKKSLSENSKTLTMIATTLKAIANSENNLSKSLDMISQQLSMLDKKSDRNYLEIKKGEKDA